MADVKFTKFGFYPRVIHNTQSYNWGTGRISWRYYNNWIPEEDPAMSVITDYSLLPFNEQEHAVYQYRYKNSTYDETVKLQQIQMFSEWAYAHPQNVYKNVSVINSKSFDELAQGHGQITIGGGEHAPYHYWSEYSNIPYPPWIGASKGFRYEFHLVRNLLNNDIKTNSALDRIEIQTDLDGNITANMVMKDNPATVLKSIKTVAGDNYVLPKVWSIYPGINTKIDNTKIITSDSYNSFYGLSLNTKYSFLDISSDTTSDIFKKDFNGLGNRYPITQTLSFGYPSNHVDDYHNLNKAPANAYILFQTEFTIDTEEHGSIKNLTLNKDKILSWDALETADNGYEVQITNYQKEVLWTKQTNATSIAIPNQYFIGKYNYKVRAKTNKQAAIWSKSTTTWHKEVYRFVARIAGQFTVLTKAAELYPVKDINVIVDVNNVTISWGYDFNKYPGYQIIFAVGVYKNYDTQASFIQINNGNSTTYKAKFPVGNHKFTIKAIAQDFPDSYSETKTVFATTKRLEAPYDLAFKLNTIDDGTLTWKSVQEDTERFKYNVYLNDALYAETDYSSYDINNLNIGKNKLAVQQVYIEDETYNSDKTLLEFTTGKLSSPYNLKFTRQSVNSGKLTWSSTNTNIANSDFSVFIDGVEVQEKTKNTNLILYNLKQGERSFTVKQNYNDNNEYDSDQSSALLYDMTKITKPTISLKENYSDVKYTDPNTGKVVYVKDEQGNNIQGISSVNVNWDTTDTAKFGGIEFILYDRWNAEISEYQSSAKTLILSTQPTYKGVGVHNLYVKSIFPADQDYNSDLSPEVQYEVNTLGEPSVTWANELPSWNGKRIFESKLTWLPVTTGSATGEHADYYLIKAIADDKDQGNGVTILQPTDLTKRLETFIPDPDPYTGDIKGLISSDPSKTTDYKINVYAMSFNEFYVGGSKPGTADYKIIRLNKPVNVQFNPDNLTLSWDAVTDANVYYIYDGGNKIVETDKTTYKFDNLENDLHIFQISAMKITKEEA